MICSCHFTYTYILALHFACLQSFDANPHYKLMKELFTQIFGTPCNHPKSQPFIDNVYTFSISDNRVWFRNYQIVEESGSLTEIGMVLIYNM